VIGGDHEENGIGDSNDKRSMRYHLTNTDDMKRTTIAYVSSFGQLSRPQECSKAGLYHLLTKLYDQ